MVSFLPFFFFLLNCLRETSFFELVNATQHLITNRKKNTLVTRLSGEALFTMTRLFFTTNDSSSIDEFSTVLKARVMRSYELLWP